MPDLILILAVVGTFLIAGTVKGVIGMGLPSVALALLTLTVDLTSAMALMLVPSLVTNIWQAAVGGHGIAILRRIWPFLITAFVTVWLGAAALTRVDLALLTVLLGVLLASYALVSLAGWRVSISRHNEGWVGALVGIVNGTVTGMTGAFVMPSILYLQAIGLTKDALIQAMGLVFSISTVALAIALQGNGLLTADLGVLSLAALVPALIGMAAGQRIRRQLSEARFRRVFFVGLLLLGLFIIVGAVGDIGAVPEG